MLIISLDGLLEVLDKYRNDKSVNIWLRRLRSFTLYKARCLSREVYLHLNFVVPLSVELHFFEGSLYIYF